MNYCGYMKQYATQNHRYLKEMNLSSATFFAQMSSINKRKSEKEKTLQCTNQLFFIWMRGALLELGFKGFDQTRWFSKKDCQLHQFLRKLKLGSASAIFQKASFRKFWKNKLFLKNFCSETKVTISLSLGNLTLSETINITSF